MTNFRQQVFLALQDTQQWLAKLVADHDGDIKNKDQKQISSTFLNAKRRYEKNQKLIDTVIDLGPNPMRTFGYLDGWNSALDAAVEDLLNLDNKHSCGCIDAIKKLKKESNE